jgi:hypothetical protein
MVFGRFISALPLKIRIIKCYWFIFIGKDVFSEIYLSSLATMGEPECFLTITRSASFAVHADFPFIEFYQSDQANANEYFLTDY